MQVEQKNETEKTTFSREAYLREIIEREAVAPAVYRQEMAYEALVIRLLYFLDINNREWLQLLALIAPDWKEQLTAKVSKTSAEKE